MLNYSLALSKKKSVVCLSCSLSLILSLSFSLFHSGKFMHARAGQPFEKHNGNTVSWVVPSYTLHTEASVDHPPVPRIRYKYLRTRSEIPGLPCFGRTQIVYHQNLVLFSLLNRQILRYISHCCCFIYLLFFILMLCWDFFFFFNQGILRNQIKIFN